MDFITGLPNSEGKSAIMVVVDRLTKYAQFCALSHPFKASTATNFFIETVQKLLGTPNIIVSDKDLILVEIFGPNYFLVWVLNWLVSHLIILNLMGKHRENCFSS